MENSSSEASETSDSYDLSSADFSSSSENSSEEETASNTAPDSHHLGFLDTSKRQKIVHLKTGGAGINLKLFTGGKKKTTHWN